MSCIKIQGVIPAMVTLFDEEQRLDEAAMREHVEFLLDKGVHGIFCLGSMGEFAYLSEEERNKTVEIVVDQVAGRVPVIVGTSHFSTRVSIRLSREAEKLGADAVMSVLVPYFPLTEEMVYNYYKKLAEEVNIPVFIYNFPMVTRFDISPETIAKLAEIDNVVGLKDTVIDANHTKRVLELVPKDFIVMPGSELTLQASLEAGAKGAIFGTSNIEPKPLCEVFKLYNSGNVEKAKAYMPEATKLLELLLVAPMECGPSLIKNAMKLYGRKICTAVRSPLPQINAEQLEKLKLTMEKLGLHSKKQ
ncbi:MAG: dihydrodipicolinate synthase family protein [Candidatus Freyarchaeota archaeon]